MKKAALVFLTLVAFTITAGGCGGDSQGSSQSAETLESQSEYLRPLDLANYPELPWPEEYVPLVPSVSLGWDAKSSHPSFRLNGDASWTTDVGIVTPNPDGTAECYLRNLVGFNPYREFWFATKVLMADSLADLLAAPDVGRARHLVYMNRFDYPAESQGEWFFLGYNVDSQKGTFTMHSYRPGGGGLSSFNGHHENVVLTEDGTLEGTPYSWDAGDELTFCGHFTPTGYRLVILAEGIVRYDQTIAPDEHHTLLDPAAQIVFDDSGDVMEGESHRYAATHHGSTYRIFVIGNGEMEPRIGEAVEGGGPFSKFANTDIVNQAGGSGWYFFFPYANDAFPWGM